MASAEGASTMSRLPKMEAAAKRLFDLCCASIALLALSPVFALVALLIWLDSGLPIFYRGIRTGMHSRPFRIYKFRTMVQDAEHLGGPSTGKDDPRVTRVGKYLRKHKLDELPQLLNVLKGEMSIVGPRPEVPLYTRLYVGDEQLVLTVRPGITDYASIEFVHQEQVVGSESPDQVFVEKVLPVKNALRVKYVKEQSFRGDIAIIVRTILRLIGV